MRITVNGAEIFASTGGRKTKEGAPNLIFLHGSGQSHLSWTQQARRFAYDDYNVFAVDFPGHGLSEGDALISIETMADWVVAFMDAASIQSATMIGHSQGCLVALEIASRYPRRTDAAVFIAGAAAIPVNEYLVGLAESKEPKAIAAMMDWGSGSLAHKFDNTVPGASHIGAGTQLMHANTEGALAADLNACNAYQNGLEAAKAIQCPTVCILAEKDKMTPLKGGLKLAGALGIANPTVIKGAGHMITGENPREVNDVLRAFLTSATSS